MFTRFTHPVFFLFVILICLGLVQANSLHDAIQQNNLASIQKLLTSYPWLINQVDDQGAYPLQLAAGNSDNGLVKYLLGKGAKVNSCDTNGMTPLLTAASEKKLDIVKLLLSKGADPHSVNEDGDTFLHFAAASKNLQIVQIALENGGDVRARDDKQCTPLHAVFGLSNHIDLSDENSTTGLMIRLYKFIAIALPEGKEKEEARQELDRMLHNDIYDIVKLLIERGAEVDPVNTTGETPLLTATKAGEEATVLFLLEKGANPAIKDQDGHTFLHYAAGSGNEILVKLALEKGGNVNALDDYRNTPLHYALNVVATGDTDFFGALFGAMMSSLSDSLESLFSNIPEDYLGKLTDEQQEAVKVVLNEMKSNPRGPVVKLLLEQGADAKAVNIKGDTPLLGAAGIGGVETLRMLVAHGASLNVIDEDGKTPMLIACEARKADIIKYLYEQGCSVNMADEKGGTPLMSVASNANVELLGYLLSKGAKVNIVDNAGDTALHYAMHISMMGSEVKTINLLLKNGANVNAKNKEGDTPLHIAVKNGYQASVKALLAKGSQVNILNNTKQTPLQSLLAKQKEKQMQFTNGKAEVKHYELDNDEKVIVTLLKKAGAK